MAKRDIEGLRTVVTGASSGIGRALAIELAAHGAKLVLMARRQEKLDEVANKINQQRGDAKSVVQIVVGDVTDPAMRQQALDAAVSSYGGLDALVNNAGIGAFGTFDVSDEERLRRIMEVNFFAAAELMRSAIPLLKKESRSIIVNVGSILGHRGLPRVSEYCASKFALRGLSESLRIELRKIGIDLLMVSPGSTESEFYDNVIEGQNAQPWDRKGSTPASTVAKKTVKAMRRGKREIIPNFLGGLLVWGNNRAPRIVDRIMSRYA